MVAAQLAVLCIGRFVPAAVTASLFGALGLDRARRLVLRMAALDPAGRAALLAGESPRRWAPFLLRHRYLAFAAALNLPGNTLLGGGGGLALAAGMSGLFAPAPFLVTLLLAVAPLPLFVLLSGYAP